MVYVGCKASAKTDKDGVIGVPFTSSALVLQDGICQETRGGSLLVLILYVQSSCGWHAYHGPHLVLTYGKCRRRVVRYFE
jgi:hypothetical protein